MLRADADSGADLRLRQRVGQLLGARVAAMQELHGGCVADVRRIDLADGRRVVVKVATDRGRPDGAVAARDGLAVEGWMLQFLAAHSSLPVPAVLWCEGDLLVMDHVEHDGGGAADMDAADHLAALHATTSPHFGLERDTAIGSLVQPNLPFHKWVDFFRERRLLHFGRAALDEGALPPSTFARLERLAARLDQWIGEPAAPSLVHGDVWAGNVLCRGDRVVAFVDPAIHFAHAEVELAFTTLFATFGENFYRRYAEHRPIEPGFFGERDAIYNLYPLLVHLRLFGAGYLAPIEATLRRFVG